MQNASNMKNSKQNLKKFLIKLLKFYEYLENQYPIYSDGINWLAGIVAVFFIYCVGRSVTWLFNLQIKAVNSIDLFAAHIVCGISTIILVAAIYGVWCGIKSLSNHWKNFNEEYLKSLNNFIDFNQTIPTISHTEKQNTIKNLNIYTGK